MAVRGHRSAHVHTSLSTSMDPKERARLVNDALREYEIRERAHEINWLVKEKMTAKSTPGGLRSDPTPSNRSVRLRERLALLKGSNPSPRKTYPSPPRPAPPPHPRRGSHVVRLRGRRISRSGGGHTMVAATELPAGLLSGGGSPSQVSAGRELSAERGGSVERGTTRRGRGRGRPQLRRGSLRQVSLEKARGSGDEDQKSPGKPGRGWMRSRARARGGRSRGRPPLRFRAARVTPQNGIRTEKDRLDSDADDESENKKSDHSGAESESGDDLKSLSTVDIDDEDSKDEVVVEQEIISLNRDVLENGDDDGDGRDSPNSDMVTVFPCVQVVQNSDESGAESEMVQNSDESGAESENPPTSNVVLDALPSSSDSETTSLPSPPVSQPPTLAPVISLPGRFPTILPWPPSLAPRHPAPPPNAAGGRTILVGRQDGGPPTMVRVLPVPSGSAKGASGQSVRPPPVVKPLVGGPAVVRPTVVRPGMVRSAVVHPSVIIRPAPAVTAPTAAGPRSIRTVVISDISQPKSVVSPRADKEEPLSEQPAAAAGSDAETSSFSEEDSAAEMTPDTDMPSTELLQHSRELNHLKGRLKREEAKLRIQQVRLRLDPPSKLDQCYPLPPSPPPLPDVSEWSATPGLVARDGALTALRRLQRQHLALYKWALRSRLEQRQSQTRATAARREARRERRRLRYQLSGLLSPTHWKVLQCGIPPATFPWPEGDLQRAAELRAACGDRGYQYLQSQCRLPLPALDSLPPTEPWLTPAAQSPRRPGHRVVTLAPQGSHKVATVSSQLSPQKTSPLAAQCSPQKAELGADLVRRISCRLRVKKEDERSAEDFS